jgi:hypothetical protein
MRDLLLTPREAARVLGIEVEAFLGLADAGECPPPVRVAAELRWPAHGLIAWALTAGKLGRLRKRCHRRRAAEVRVIGAVRLQVEPDRRRADLR